MIEITGDWIGYYTFGERYGDWGKDRRVPFRMKIQRGISEFVGRIFEETDYGGIDDEITIRGRQNGDEIEFTKHYTQEHLLNENGEQVSLKSDSPTIVYYKGEFDFNDNQFKGEWEIPVLREDEDGVFHSDNDSGRWCVWKED
jgi:hypothetical protein